MVSGITDLKVLLESMSPRLLDGEWVFVTLDQEQNLNKDLKTELYDVALMTYKEREGLSMLLPVDVASEKGFTYDAIFRGITLDVHSSLEAVGLTAAVSAKLAKHGLSANVIAATFHDHVFVGKDDAEKAMALLEDKKFGDDED